MSANIARSNIFEQVNLRARASGDTSVSLDRQRRFAATYDFAVKLVEFARTLKCVDNSSGSANSGGSFDDYVIFAGFAFQKN